MDLATIRRDFSYKECEILVRLAMANNKKMLNMSGLAAEIKIEVTNPYFQRIMKYLIEIGGVEVTEFGSVKLVTLKQKVIRDLVDEQEICEAWYDYFKAWHIISW